MKWYVPVYLHAAPTWKHLQVWIPNQIEILLGLSGEGAEKGYWREPPFDIKGGIHDQDSSTRRSSEGYICHG